MSIPEFATPEKTGEFTTQFKSQNTSLAYRRLGRTNLRVSALGFGTYRCHAEIAEHKTALKLALQKGCNLIDTSANYTDGMAEVLIGDVLNEEIVWNGKPREQFIVVSKAGYIQGENYEIATNREREENPFPEIVKYQSGLWHCIHPVFIEDQITRSLSRMHLDTLDIYLLHNPEYFLMHAHSQGFDPQLAEKQFYNRLRRAFTAMEKLVSEGLIRWYGISSNSLPLPDDHPHHVSLAKVWAAYEDACLQQGITPEQGHFAVIQMPYNRLENGAATLQNNAFRGESFSVLALAKKLNLGVLVNRPLNALKDNQLIRLARYGAKDDVDYRQEFENEIEALERAEEDLISYIVRSDFNFKIEGKSVREFLLVSSLLRQLTRELTDVSRYKEMVNYYISPVMAVGQKALLNRVTEAEKPNVSPLLKQYFDQFVAAVNAWILYLDAQNSIQLRELDKAFDRENPDFSQLTFSQKSLLSILRTQGVDVVLNGMRLPAYVEDSMGVLPVL